MYNSIRQLTFHETVYTISNATTFTANTPCAEILIKVYHDTANIQIIVAIRQGYELKDITRTQAYRNRELPIGTRLADVVDELNNIVLKKPKYMTVVDDLRSRLTTING